MSGTRTMGTSTVDRVSHVLVGYSSSCLASLDDLLLPGSVMVVEEPDVIAARRVPEALAGHRCVASLVTAPTQAEDEPGALVAAVPRPAGVRAVVPAVEYGVIGAAALADRWGLPGAGLAAAHLLRDKAALRDAAAAAGLPQPAYRRVTGPDEVAAFRDRHGGHCVLKPTNRQASLGVLRLGPGDDVRAAWRASTGAGEPAMRAWHAPAPGYLVEERMRGPEVSVETLVFDGVPGFTNVTAKLVQAGPRPVELGHTVPADLGEDDRRDLAAAARTLVAVTGFRYGVLHSEWIIGPAGPRLVECAARLPGDSIDTLIDLAYDGCLLADYLAVLEGRRPAPPRPARRAAAIRFLTAPARRVAVGMAPGTAAGDRAAGGSAAGGSAVGGSAAGVGVGAGVVAAVSGRASAAAVPGVREVHVAAAPGQLIRAAASSWDRCGYVIATGGDAVTAGAAAATAAALITVTLAVEPPPARLVPAAFAAPAEAVDGDRFGSTAVAARG
jgi:biotin carboxylase